MMRKISNALVLASLASCLCSMAAGCQDFRCWGLTVCIEGVCTDAPACDASSITFADETVEVNGDRCKVTLEDIHQSLPESVTKEGTVYTLNHKLVITNDCLLEIHGPESATEGAGVTLLQLKVRACWMEEMFLYVVPSPSFSLVAFFAVEFSA